MITRGALLLILAVFAKVGFAEPGKDILGKWFEVGGKEYIEFFEDGTVIHTEGSKVYSFKWKLLDKKRLLVTLLGEGQIKEIVALTKQELALKDPKGKIDRYRRKREVLTLRPGQSLTRGAVKFTFTRLVFGRVWGQDPKSEPSIYLCYELRNISDVTVVVAAEYRDYPLGPKRLALVQCSGGAKDEFGNVLGGKPLPAGSLPPPGVIIDIEPGSGHWKTPKSERKKLEPGNGFRAYFQAGAPPIEKAKSFLVEGCWVSTDNHGSKASFRLAFTREDLDASAAQVDREKRTMLEALERVLSSGVLEGEVWLGKTRLPCQVSLSYEKETRKGIGTIDFPTLQGKSRIRGVVHESPDGGWWLSLGVTEEIQRARNVGIIVWRPASRGSAYKLRLATESGKPVLKGEGTRGGIRIGPVSKKRRPLGEPDGTAPPSGTPTAETAKKDRAALPTSRGGFRHGTLVARDAKNRLVEATTPQDTQFTHPGVDLPGKEGNPVHAVAGGAVVEIVAKGHDYYRFLGNAVMVETARTSPGLTTYTIYLHLKERPLVQPGGRVSRGDKLGYVGATGAVTGPHVHFEVRHFRTWLSTDTEWMPIKDGKPRPNIYGRGDQRFTWRFYRNWTDPDLFQGAMKATARRNNLREQLARINKELKLYNEIGKQVDQVKYAPRRRATWEGRLAPGYLKVLQLIRLARFFGPSRRDSSRLATQEAFVFANLASYWAEVRADAKETVRWLEAAFKGGLLQHYALDKLLADDSWDAVRTKPEFQRLVARYRR